MSTRTDDDGVMIELLREIGTTLDGILETLTAIAEKLDQPNRSD